MRLKSLKTQNFKKLGTREFTFSTGLNVIAGDNAQGKTTLLQGIETALFGVRAIPGKAEHIATWGQKKWSLTLDFEGKDLKHYSVTRTGSTAKLVRIEGEETTLVANGTTPVNEMIEELLGLAAKDYNLFIQSKQGESTGILTFGATALNRKVEEYAGVQVIEAVQAKAQLKSTSLAASAEAKRVPEEVLAQAQVDLDAATEGLANANLAHQRAQGKLEELGQFSLPVVEDNVAAMREEAHQADLLWAKVEAAEQALVPAKKTLDDAVARAAGVQLQDAEALIVKRIATEEKGQEAKKALANLRVSQQKYTSAAQEVERCKQALEQADKVSASAQPSAVGVLPAAEELVETCSSALTLAQNKATEADVKVRNLKQMADGAQCPTCGHTKEDHDPAKLAQELEQAQAELTEAVAARSAAKTALDLTQRTLKGHEEQDRKAEAALSAFEAAEKALLAAQYALGDLPRVDDSAIHDAETQYETLRSEYAALQAQVEQVNRNNETYRREQAAEASARQAHSLAVETYEKLAKQFEDLPEPPTEEEIAQRQREVDAYREAQAAWKVEHGNRSMDEREAAADVRIAQQTLGTAQATSDRLAAQNEQADKDAIMSKKYDRLVRFLRDGRHGYMQQVWDTILGVSSRLVNGSSRGQITRIINDGGEFMFEEAGITAPSSSASGAQRSFIGTALRTGLSRALYGSDSLMIFDEPTEACSEHNASAMAATLATSAKQVLLITHRETDQVLASKIINVGA